MATTARSAGGTTGRLPARIRSSWLASADAQILLAIVIVGAVARFATLSSQSYWLDEATTVHELGLSFGAMLHSWSSVEADPPLYFLIAWPWSRVFGLGEAGVRSLSARVRDGIDRECCTSPVASWCPAGRGWSPPGWPRSTRS